MNTEAISIFLGGLGILQFPKGLKMISLQFKLNMYNYPEPDGYSMWTGFISKSVSSVRQFSLVRTFC